MYKYSYLEGHWGHPHYITYSQIKNLQKKIVKSSDDARFLIIIKNLSDPTKFKIFMLLHKVDDISVTGISETLKISQSSASHALSDLKNIGLVRGYRCGKLLCYTLANKDKKTANYLSMFVNLFGGYRSRRWL